MRSQIRLDRIATLHFFHPLARRSPEGETSQIPILMYHSISEGDQAEARPYYDVCTSPRVFEEQMAFLKESGRTVLSLSDVVRILDSGDFPEKKCAAITFDDGYRDFLTSAFPVLSKFGFSATVFLPTAYIENAAQVFKGRPCLTWSEVRELQRSGIDFGSHTVTHPKLWHLPLEKIREEVRVSKQSIEDALGVPVRSFSYPYAFPEVDRPFRKALRDVLAENGYQYGVSTILGTAQRTDDRYCLPRLPVNRWDDLSFFRAKLERGYDWLHQPQYLAKWLQRAAFQLTGYERD